MKYEVTYLMHAHELLNTAGKWHNITKLYALLKRAISPYKIRA